MEVHPTSMSRPLTSPTSLDPTAATERLFARSVIVINCGGTITMSGDAVLSPGNALEATLVSSQLSQHEVMIVRAFDRPPDSSTMCEEMWHKIVGIIETIAERKRAVNSKLLDEGIRAAVAGIVIAHGTDTLEYTALLLALEESARHFGLPILITGSHAPPGAIGSDAESNLRKSIYMATEKLRAPDRSLLPGVYVLIGVDIHLAARLTKTRTSPDSEGRYFHSHPVAIGQITSDGSPDGYSVRLDKDYSMATPWTAPESNPRRPCADVRLGIVEHIVIDSHCKEGVVQSLARRLKHYQSLPKLSGRRVGVVVQGNFAKNPHCDRIIEQLKQLDADAILVGSFAVFQRCKKREVDDRVMLIPKGLAYAKAHLKLRWLLGKGLSAREMFQWLESDLAGEIPPSGNLPDWTRFESTPNLTEGTAVVIAHPDVSERVFADAVDSLRASKRGRRELYAYGFGNGHLPVANRSLLEIVNSYLGVEQLALGTLEVAGSTVSEIEVSLSGLIQDLDVDGVARLRQYVPLKYTVNKGRLLRAMQLEAAARHRINERERLRRIIERILRKYKRQRLLIKNHTEIIDAAVETAKYNLDEYAQRELVFSKQEGFDEGDDGHWVRLMVREYPALLARRVIRDSVAAACPILGELSRATDLGIRVVMRTQALRSDTDLAKYEVGNMLLVVGADSDVERGWKLGYLTPRRSGEN